MGQKLQKKRISMCKFVIKTKKKLTFERFVQCTNCQTNVAIYADSEEKKRRSKNVEI